MCQLFYCKTYRCLQISITRNTSKTHTPQILSSLNVSIEDVTTKDLGHQLKVYEIKTNFCVKNNRFYFLNIITFTGFQLTQESYLIIQIVFVQLSAQPECNCHQSLNVIALDAIAIHLYKNSKKCINLLLQDYMKSTVLE